MDEVHCRCAGMDISKKDAKVCVRVAGAGRRKTVETVTTWGSTTGAVRFLPGARAGTSHCVGCSGTCQPRSAGATVQGRCHDPSTHEHLLPIVATGRGAR